IELSEIEFYLAAHPNINESVVSALEDASGNKYLVGYLTLDKEKESLNVKELQNFLGKSLPHYMIPAIYVFLKSFPLNTNGKIDRKKLPKPNLETSKNYQAPESLLEQKIADIWMETLAITRVGRQDNFFEQGGDSLKAMRMISRLKKTLSHNVSIRLLFEHPILWEFASIIEKETLG
ncbi:MAG: phosphopantetheine-binding protein, partial [Cyclobacteriaceae bacterium]